MKSSVLLLALCASNVAGLHQKEKFPTGSPMIDAAIIGTMATSPGLQAAAAVDAASKAVTMTGMAGLPIAAAALPLTAAAIPLTASASAAAAAGTSVLDAADKVAAPLVGAATKIMDSAASVGGLMLDSAAGVVESATPPVSFLQKEQENAPFDLVTSHVADMLAPPSKVGDDPAFATIDKDKNGRITKAETMTMLAPIAGPFAPVVAKKQFRETDTNKDGVISYEEFMNWKHRQDGEEGYQAFREHSSLEAD